MGQEKAVARRYQGKSRRRKRDLPGASLENAVEQTAGSITLAGAKNERTVIPRNRIDDLRESPVSLMPEDLLKSLKPQEVRDLFAYLQADAPPGGKR